jgi:hypothetical protein
VRQPLVWLARLFGAFLVFYSVFLAYQPWQWTRMGLHQRVYDGESQFEIELNVVYYAIFYDPSMRYAALLLLAGTVIIIQTVFTSREVS